MQGDRSEREVLSARERAMRVGEDRLLDFVLDDGLETPVAGDLHRDADGPIGELDAPLGTASKGTRTMERAERSMRRPFS